MDSLNRYQQIVENVLRDYAAVRYAHGHVDKQCVFDRDHNHYLVVTVGWDERRVHGCLIHVDLIDGKCWIQRDGTEHGIARDLEAAGIPKSNIVLAFKKPDVRPHTGYAVA